MVADLVSQGLCTIRHLAALSENSGHSARYCSFIKNLRQAMTLVRLRTVARGVWRRLVFVILDHSVASHGSHATVDTMKLKTFQNILSQSRKCYGGRKRDRRSVARHHPTTPHHPPAHPPTCTHHHPRPVGKRVSQPEKRCFTFVKHYYSFI